VSRVKSFANGSTVFPADLNSVQDDYEAAFSTYKVRREAWASCSNSGIAASGTYLMCIDGGGSPLAAGAGSALATQRAFYIDPADHAASPRAAKWRLRFGSITNAVAPGVTMTLGLYPVTGWGGASGSNAIVQTVGTVTSGSTVAIATPGASSVVQQVTSDFVIASAGWYSLGIVFNAAIALNSFVSLSTVLQFRQV
jgi:hypothetical protein